MTSTQPDARLLQDFITLGLAEDIGAGDVTTLACIDPLSQATAYLLVKEEGVLAGAAVAMEIFRHADPDCRIELHLQDGDLVQPGQRAFTIHGRTHALLQTERLALNTMQRMSGIATLTRRYRHLVADLPVQLLDTRKTTPGIRFLEKWAVQLGGGTNYRYGLYDWFMIKDNHITACGSVGKAIQRVADYQKRHGTALPVTVEVRTLNELDEVLRTGQVTRIMFDNFQPESLREGVSLVSHRFETEASGGINLETLRPMAMTGVDYISIGALTHSAQALDLSLKIA